MIHVALGNHLTETAGEVVIGNPAKLANYGSIVNTAKTVVLPNAAAAASNASASYDGFYVTELGGMAVGNKSIPISSELGYALFDTGTTNIFAPDEVSARLEGQPMIAD